MNGCGCERGLLKYVRPPYADKFYVACCLHDNDYDRGGTSIDRIWADRELYMNMMKIVRREHSYSPWRTTWLTLIAHLYYVCVRVFGWMFFNYRRHSLYLHG